MNPTWLLTDSAGYQHVRRITATEFELIEIYAHDEDCEKFGVYNGLVNLSDWTPSQLNPILNTFDYADIDAVFTEYGDSAYQVIAECVFESMGYSNNQIFTGSKLECIRFINDCISITPKIWMRLGVSLKLPPELASKVLSGDVSVLKEAIEKGYWELDGESYIPEEVMEALGHGYYDVNFNVSLG